MKKMIFSEIFFTHFGRTTNGCPAGSDVVCNERDRKLGEISPYGKYPTYLDVPGS